MNTAHHRCAMLANKFPNVCINIGFLHNFNNFCFYFFQIYQYLCNNEPALIFYAPNYAANETPPNYMHIKTLEEINLLSGAALLYSKKIIIVTRSYETIQSHDFLYIVKLT